MGERVFNTASARRVYAEQDDPPCEYPDTGACCDCWDYCARTEATCKAFRDYVQIGGDFDIDTRKYRVKEPG